MKQYKSSAKQNTYEKYLNYSTEKLKNNIESGKYREDVIEVIKDILIERNELSSTYKTEKTLKDSRKKLRQS